MSERTFGRALGELILQKRRKAGLTQVQLAEDAYGEPGKTRRISELENGLVANPHPKTIDPITAVLKISPEEIEACAISATTSLDPTLDRAYREARNLIEALAYRFEHANPHATIAELEDFLRTKAEEWADLRDRMATIEAADGEQEALIAQASSALSDGNFDQADELLEAAEEKIHNENTLREIRRAANIRIMRADGMIIKGDSERALALYSSAVEYYRPFDEKEMSDAIEYISQKIYETSLRSFTQYFSIARTLMEKLLSLRHVREDGFNYSKSSYRLSLIYRNEYESNPNAADAGDLLEKAIEYAEIASTYRHDAENVVSETSTKILLANCLGDRAMRNGASSDITKAIEILIAARDMIRENNDQELLSHACNSLGVSFLRSRHIHNRNDTEDLNAALEAFSECVRAAETTAQMETWSAAKANIGSVLAEKAHFITDSEQKKFVRVRAISEINASIEGYPLVLFPRRCAEAHLSLARILTEQAQDLPADLAEIHLMRAIHSFEVAEAGFDPNGTNENAEKIALIQACLGGVFATHARMEGIQSSHSDLQQAVHHLRRAVPIYRSLNQSEDAELCERKIDELTEAMGKCAPESDDR